MKYKLIALDLDGTLVNKANHFTKQNIEALIAYHKKGGLICFVSGRSIWSALFLYNKIKKKHPDFQIEFICALNSSLIYDVKNEEFLEHNFLDNNIAKEILAFSKEKDIIFCNYNQESLKTKSINVFNMPKIFKFLFKNKKGFNFDFFTIYNTYKINIITKTTPEKFREIIKEYENKFSDLVSFSKTSRVMAEITNKNVNKGLGIEFLSKKLQISKDEIVAIGDSANDIPMFEKVGLALAVNDKRLKRLEFKNCVFLNKKIKDAISFGIYEYILKYEK